MKELVVTADQLERRAIEGVYLAHHEGSPYTGRAEKFYENGQKEWEATYKDGKQDGIDTRWYENGQKQREENWKDGLFDGLSTTWYKNGQKESEGSWKDGKTMSVESWKPNGEKCPVTNVKDGNGVEVTYKDDGNEAKRYTYKDGEPVKDPTFISPETQRAMNEKKYILTKEIVEELVRVADDLKYDERLDFLRPYTSITLEGAEMIGNEFNSWFHFPCIKEIEPHAADHLAKVSVLTFDALETLSPETAEALAAHKGSSLELGGTWKISPQVAYKLSFHLGFRLILSSITELGPLESTKMPSGKGPNIADAFWPDILTRQGGSWGRFWGGLSFPGIKKIPDKDLEKLSSPDMFALSWGWTQVYSSEIPQGYGFSEGSKNINLIFENLSEITEVSAKALCKTVGILELGITSLPDDAAKCFEDFHGERLILNRLKNLNDSAAESLSKVQCRLEGSIVHRLYNAENLSPPHHLELNGLTSLSDSAAESLSKQKGYLSILGLTELSDTAAESLSKHEGKLQLPAVFQAKVDAFKDD